MGLRQELNVLTPREAGGKLWCIEYPLVLASQSRIAAGIGGHSNLETVHSLVQSVACTLGSFETLQLILPCG